MKKFSLFLYISSLFLLMGCSKFLEEHPRDQISEEEAFDTPANIYLNTVATLYNYIGGNSDSQGLQGTYRGVYDLNTFTTDEAMLPTRGGDWYDGGFGKDCSCIVGERIITRSRRPGNICIR